MFLVRPTLDQSSICPWERAGNWCNGSFVQMCLQSCRGSGDIAITKEEMDMPVDDDPYRCGNRTKQDSDIIAFGRIIWARWFWRSWCLHKFIVNMKHMFLVLVISGNSEDEVVLILRLDHYAWTQSQKYLWKSSPSVILAPNVLSLLWQTRQTETWTTLIDLYCIYKTSVWL